MKRGDWKTRLGMSGALAGSTLAGGACDRISSPSGAELQLPTGAVALDPQQFLGGVVITDITDKPIPPERISDEALRDFMSRTLNDVLVDATHLTHSTKVNDHWSAIRSAHSRIVTGEYEEALTCIKAALRNIPELLPDPRGATDRFPPYRGGKPAQEIIDDCIKRESQVHIVLDCLVNGKHLTVPSGGIRTR